MKWRLSIAAMFCLTLSRASGLAEEQGLRVHFRYGSADLSRLFALEDKVEDAIKRAKVGEFDGDEVAVDGSDGFLYMSGPSADSLFHVVVPVLTTADFMNGAEVTRVYGPPGEKTRKETTVIRER